MSTKQSGRPSPRPAARRETRWVFPAVLGGIVVILGIVLVVSIAGKGGSSGSNRGGASQATHEVADKVTIQGATLPSFSGDAKDPAVGMTAPTLGTVDFQGKDVTAGGSTGKPYALVFLAHWCPHCQAEVPRLVDAGNGGTIEGVTVVGVPTGTSKSNPNYPPSAWLAREGWKYGVALDDAGFNAARAYGLTSYPYLVFVDGSGKVVGRTAGEVPEDDLKTIFSALASGQKLPLPGAGASSSAS